MEKSLDLSRHGIDLDSENEVTVELSIAEGKICEDVHMEQTLIEIRAGNRKRMALLTRLDISEGYIGTFLFSGPPTKT